MAKLPDALFIIDPKREDIAVQEAHRLRIPIFAVVDTNCNPDDIDYPIPGNDDAIRAIALFLDVIARAIVDGKSGGQSEEALIADEEGFEEAPAAEAAEADEVADEAAATDESGDRHMKKELDAKENYRKKYEEEYENLEEK